MILYCIEMEFKLVKELFYKALIVYPLLQEILNVYLVQDCYFEILLIHFFSLSKERLNMRCCLIGL